MDVSKEAARKMAIVDALTPKQRAIVWEIGLSDFSVKYPKAYKAVKAKAGIKGACRTTQHATKPKKVALATA
jgi:hypothetical protein